MNPSTLMLVLGTLLLLFTLNAFRPLYRPAPLAALSFFPAWLTAELALHHVLIQLPFAAWLVAAGALQELSGQLGLAAWVLNWFLLGACWARGLSARGAVDRALDEALGPRWTERIPPGISEHLPRGPERWRWALPFSMRRREVEVLRDIPFAKLDDGRQLRLDLFRPKGRPTGCPGLVFVHGGGWVLGYKERQGLPMLQSLAAQGWVCASIDYRLSPRATFPDHIIDVKRGIAWLREHAAEQGVDPRLIVVTGNSAGGHLAALAALTPDETAWQPGFESADTSVAGCVTFYGVYDLVDRERLWPHRDGIRLLQKLVMKRRPEDDPAAYDRASPLTRVRPDAPPFLVVHGTIDGLAPVAGARSFVRALRAVSRSPVAYAEIPGGQHAFEVFHSPRADGTLDGVFRFLAWLRGVRVDG